MSRKTRKLIWSAPLVAVLAVAGALALFVALAPDPAEAHGPPGPVTGISATASGYDTINLSWNKPDSGSDVTGYRIDYADDPYVWKALVADTGDTKTTYKDEGLKPETTRYYRVFGMNGAGSGPVSTDESYAFTTTGEVQAPGPVLNLVATSGAGKIDLKWRAPADSGGAKIMRYCIVAAELGTPLPDVHDSCDDETATFTDGFFRAKGGSAGTWTLQVVTEDNKTKYEHKVIDADDNVSEGQQWAFQVYAANQVGTGGTAELVQGTTASNRATASVDKPASASKPDAPMNLKGVQTASTTVQLFWNVTEDVAEDVAGEAVDYQLQTRDYNIADRSWPSWTTATTTPIEFTPNDTDTHQYEVSSVENNVDGTVRVQYRVRVTGPPVSSWSNPAEVRLVDQDITPADVLPTLLLANLEDVTQRSLYDTIQLNWERDPNAGIGGGDDDFTDEGDVAPTRPTGYVIDFRDASLVSTNIYSSWTRLQSNTGYSRTYYYHRGLEQGSHIQYRIFPWHENRFGSPQIKSARTKSAVTPDPVRGLTVMADGPDKLTLNWPAVTNTGGSPITGYRIEVATSETENWPAFDDEADNDATDAPVTGIGVAKSVDANTTTYTYTDDDLVSGSTRWFRVFALNVQNDEDDETGSVITTGPTDSDRASAVPKKGTTAAGPNPMAPEDLTSELAKTSSLYTFGQTGVLLLWNTAKESRDYDPVANYEVQRMVNGGDWEDLFTTTNTDTFHTDEDLPVMGEMRAYRVRSETAAGKVSPWSNMTYFPGMHGMDTAHVMASGTLDAQTVDVDAMVTVDASAGFTGDMLMYSVMSSDDTVAMATVDEMSGMVTITGVADGTATITVTATDAAGESATQMIMVTVEAADTSLKGPGNVAVSPPLTAGGGDIGVTWDAVEGVDQYRVFVLTSNPTTIVAAPAVPADMRSATITLDPGMYRVIVAAFRMGERFAYEAATPITVP